MSLEAIIAPIYRGVFEQIGFWAINCAKWTFPETKSHIIPSLGQIKTRTLAARLHVFPRQGRHCGDGSGDDSMPEPRRVGGASSIGPCCVLAAGRRSGGLSGSTPGFGVTRSVAGAVGTTVLMAGELPDGVLTDGAGNDGAVDGGMETGGTGVVRAADGGPG